MLLELVRNRMAQYVMGLPGVARILRGCEDPSHHSASPGGCPNSERSSALDPFQALVAIIAIVTVGGVVSRIISVIGRAFSRPAAPLKPSADSPQIVSGEQDSAREAIAELSGRLERLEEERDFYKDLLDSPATRREIAPPDSEPEAERDASDPGGRS